MATYIKLRNNTWGAKVTQDVNPGDKIIVLKRSGETKEEVVSKVLFRGNGISIVSLQYNRRSYRYMSVPRGICEDAPCCGCCDVGGRY
jgi:hypothetical protein